MRINSISEQNFESKRFRIVVEPNLYSTIGSSVIRFKTSSKYVKEYSNPRAEEIYNKIQKSNDIYEKAALTEFLGHYELKELNFKEKFQSVLDKLLTDFLFKG